MGGSADGRTINFGSSGIGIGGTVITALSITATLQLAEFRWEAPVSYCQPWPLDSQLLGQHGFLRWFKVNSDAASEVLEINPHIQ